MSLEAMRDLESMTDYELLLTSFKPRPVHSQAEADTLTEMIDALTDLPRLSEGQRDFLDLIGQLIYEWESTHEEPVQASPQEIVRSLLEDNGMRQQDLVGPVFPSRHAVSDFLAGRRPLSYERVGKLAQFFHVSPAVFYPAAYYLPRRSIPAGAAVTHERQSEEAPSTLAH